MLQNVVSPKYKIVGKVDFTTAYVIDHTILPENPKDIPQIVGWSGPARTGTTALLFLLAGHPQVDRVYFQPQKTLLRYGKPDFELFAGDKLVCMKEVFGQLYAEENYDPIDMLLRAGVPAEKITWISFLRDPAQTFASWYVHQPNGPEVFAEAQKHAIKYFYYYREKGVRILPFVYDLIENNESQVITALLRHMGIDDRELSLDFKPELIKNKFIHGQAKDEKFFEIYVEPTLARKKFVYSRNDYDVPVELMNEIERLCRPGYEEFYKLAKQELGVA